MKPFPLVGDRPLDRKVIGVRFPVEVAEALRSLPSPEMQALIREAVETELKNRGLI